MMIGTFLQRVNCLMGPHLLGADIITSNTYMVCALFTPNFIFPTKLDSTTYGNYDDCKDGCRGIIFSIIFKTF